MTIDRIVLIGFMGSGKTTVGAELANRLAWAHVDLDRLIEQLDGRTIAQIFAEAGETRFRGLEAEVTSAIASRRNVVVSTGGGWAMNAGLHEARRQEELIVWLRVSPAQVLERLSGTEARRSRPLLAGPNPETRVRDLLAEREPVYRNADLIISTDGKSVGEVATEILENGIQET